MPISPCEAAANTAAAGPENNSPSALTISTWIVAASAMARVSWLLQSLRLLDRFLDGAHHVEGLLRKRIELAADNALEAANGVLERHALTVLASEHLGAVEGLGKETLHF